MKEITEQILNECPFTACKGKQLQTEAAGKDKAVAIYKSALEQAINHIADIVYLVDKPTREDSKGMISRLRLQRDQAYSRMYKKKEM